MPPREVEPATVRLPKCSMMRAIHWPSKFALVSATTPRLRKNQVAARIRPCQKAMMGARPDFRISS